MFRQTKILIAMAMLAICATNASAQSGVTKKTSTIKGAEITKGEAKKSDDEKDKSNLKAMKAAIQAAQSDILANWEKCDALSAEIGMDTEILKGVYRTTSTMVGTFDFKRQKNGRHLFHEQYHTSQTHNLQGDDLLEGDQATTMWGDGQFVHTYSDGTDGRALFKNNQTPTHIIVDSKETIARMNRAYDLTLLPEEEILGESVYVFEAVPKIDADKSEKRRTLRFFSKKTGIMLKRVSFNPMGDLISTLRIEKINLNPNFSDKHFLYVKPEGVSLTDNTNK